MPSGLQALLLIKTRIISVNHPAVRMFRQECPDNLSALLPIPHLPARLELNRVKVQNRQTVPLADLPRKRAFSAAAVA